MNKDRKTGYKLHLQRLIFSGGTATRSIKFPLKTITAASSQLKENFENSIITDDLKIRGSVNLPDYQQNPDRYTLADLWLDSLRAGVIWQPTASKLTNFVRRYFKEPLKAEEIFEKAAKGNKELKFFDKRKFTNSVILADPKRKSGKPGRFRSTLLKSIKPEYKKDDQELNPQVQQLLDRIIGDFYNEVGELKLEGKISQNDYWLREFDIDKRLLDENGTTGRGGLSHLTFFVLPELIALDETLTAHELVERRKGLPIEEGKLAEVCGLENNFNALSHYLNFAFQFLYSGKTDKIFQAFTERVSAIAQYEKEVKEALEFLANKAKKLGFPKTDQAWHEYRSVFGGKIQSWFRNYQRRDKELQEQTQKLQQGIKNAQTLIDKSVQDDSSLNQEAQIITTLLGQINQLLEQDIDNLQDSKKYEMFLDLLAGARRALNFFYQKHLKEEGDDIPVNKHKKLKDFYSTVYKPMSFFAKGRLEQNKKNLSNTVGIVEVGLKIAYRFLEDNRVNFDPVAAFENVKRKDETPESLYRLALQRIWGKLKDKKVNSTEFKEKYTHILTNALEKESLWNKIYANPNKYCFYKSPYAKGTSTEVALQSTDFLPSFKFAVNDLCQFAISLKDISIFDNKDLLQDKNELIKTLVSYLTRFNAKEKFDISGLDLTQFEKARKYLEFSHADKLNRNEAAYFYQSLIFSELRGAITVFAKEKYTSRYVAQPMKTPNKFPLFYFSKTKALIADDLRLNQRGKDLLSQRPHYYCISINKDIKLTKKVISSKFMRLNKSKTEIVGIEEDNNKNLLKLTTSPYQQQFLERFVSPVGDWKKVNLTLSEWSFIVEKDYKIDWNREQKQPTFTQDGETKLFVSIPFQIRAKVKKKNTDLTKLLSNRMSYPILGIDVGEYGVGWVLAKFNNGAIDILRKGFIRDRNIAAIQNNFASIQARARKGVLNVASTTVAEVRENAIGAVRNQIHDILTKETAGVVYEYSISNFEAGSGRVTKVYNSVKRADVYSETDADYQQHAHVWGGKYITPGTHLSAYASSYTCVVCARSAYEFHQEDVGQAKVITKEGNILTIETPKGKVRGYGQDNNIEEEYHFKSTKEGFKAFMKLVKDFARPPISLRSETISKFAPYISKKQLDQFSRQRGNSAIFVCPFPNCHNVADADIQAAFMMAVRGYLNWSGKVKSDEKEKKDFLGKTLELLHSFKNRHQLSKAFSVSADVS